MDNYNDMARELGYDPTDPEHIEKMQEAFATDELAAKLEIPFKPLFTPEADFVN